MGWYMQARDNYNKSSIAAIQFKNIKADSAEVTMIFDSAKNMESAIQYFQKTSLSFKSSQPPNFFLSFKTDSFNLWIIKQRELIRQTAPILKPKGDFVIKSLRFDEWGFYKRFIEMITPHKRQKKHPLRVGNQRIFTVTGEGVFRRREFSKSDIRQQIPLKKPQYTTAEKQGFSNFQSASLALPSMHYYPPIFGHAKRGARLVGAIIPEEDVLYSNRLYIYDGGTVTRGYDENQLPKAEAYASKRIGKILFSATDVDNFKRVIVEKHPTEFNEVLVRIRLNPDNFSLFIGSDNLESRLIAVEYARYAESYLIKHKLMPENYKIPICFFDPSNPEFHLKEYTQDEKILDTIEAYQHAGGDKYYEYLKNFEYEHLLVLDFETLKQQFGIIEDKKLQKNHETRAIAMLGMPVLLHILYNGRIHLFNSLVDKFSADQLYHILDHDLKVVDHSKLKIPLHDILWEIMYQATHAKYPTLAEFIFNHYKEILIKNNTEYPEKLYKILHHLACAGDEYNQSNLSLFYLLINLPGIELYNIDSNGTLLTKLSTFGHLKLALILLAKLQRDSYFPYALTRALELSAENGHLNLLKVLLNYSKSFDELERPDFSQALIAAAKIGDNSMIKILLENGADITKATNGILKHSIEFNNIELLKMLLDTNIELRNYDYLILASNLKRVDMLEVFYGTKYNYDARRMLQLKIHSPLSEHVIALLAKWDLIIKQLLKDDISPINTKFILSESDMNLILEALVTSKIPSEKVANINKMKFHVFKKRSLRGNQGFSLPEMSLIDIAGIFGLKEMLKIMVEIQSETDANQSTFYGIQHQIEDYIKKHDEEFSHFVSDENSLIRELFIAINTIIGAHEEPSALTNKIFTAYIEEIQLLINKYMMDHGEQKNNSNILKFLTSLSNELDTSLKFLIEMQFQTNRNNSSLTEIKHQLARYIRENTIRGSSSFFSDNNNISSAEQPFTDLDAVIDSFIVTSTLTNQNYLTCLDEIYTILEDYIEEHEFTLEVDDPVKLSFLQSFQEQIMQQRNDLSSEPPEDTESKRLSK